MIGADLSKSYGTDAEIHSTRLRLKGRKRPSLYGYWDCNNVYTDGVQLTEPTNNKRTLAGGVALRAGGGGGLFTFFFNSPLLRARGLAIFGANQDDVASFRPP